MSADDAASKKDASRIHFDRWAEEYEGDRVSRWLAGLQQDALATLQPRLSDRLLDIGCGTGAAVRAAAAVVTHAVGVDLSAGMIARGRELATGIPNAEFRVADAEALPFERDSFSAVLCTTSFHHYPHPQRAASEMARVLQPGGRIVIADMITDRLIMKSVDALLRRLQDSHVGCHRARDLQHLLTGAGLAAPSAHTLFHGFYGIVLARKPTAN